MSAIGSRGFDRPTEVKARRVTVPLWAWAATFLAVGVVVALDIAHTRRPHEPTFREAALWSAIYIVAAVAFGFVVGLFAGGHHASEFFAGYLVEKSLSVDNLFVFALVLGRFAVPTRHQQRVLLIGVIGALVLRGIFIAVGAAAIQRFAFTFVIFGAFLIFTAFRLLRGSDEQEAALDSRLMRWVRKVVPVADVDDARVRDGALVTKAGGRRALTSLGIAVVAILSIDIMFALDSIPAIFGITQSPYLVFTTNVFAVLGLRALYFLIVGALDRLVYLHYGLATILAFIGIKLMLHFGHSVTSSAPEIPTAVSLIVVVGVLAVTTLISLLSSKRNGEKHGPGGEHASRPISEVSAG
jgi:tellurite resistance protein TerC